VLVSHDTIKYHKKKFGSGVAIDQAVLGDNTTYSHISFISAARCVEFHVLCITAALNPKGL
jgi:hypothetical protein